MKKRYYGGWRFITWTCSGIMKNHQVIRIVVGKYVALCSFYQIYTKKSHSRDQFIYNFLVLCWTSPIERKKIHFICRKCEKHSVNPTTTDRINKSKIHISKVRTRKKNTGPMRLKRNSTGQRIWNARILGNSSLFRFQYDIFHFI